MSRKLYITHCEGPVSQNDSIRELCENFIPQGGQLFRLFSQFDDYLAKVEKVTGNKWGHAPLYILPFFKAAGVTDRAIRDFFLTHTAIMKGASESLASIREIMDIYMVSTSYSHFTNEIARHTGIEPASVFSTSISFDSYDMTDQERNIFINHQHLLSQLPPIIWDETGAVHPETQFSVDSIKSFLFEQLPALSVYKWMGAAKAVRHVEKAGTILDIARQKGVPLSDVMYVGGNTSDIEALALVKNNGGLAVSFNGNYAAIMNAEYIVISRETDILRELASTFDASGKKDIPEGTVNKSAFVSLHESCEIENVIMLSENTRKELREEARRLSS